MGEIILEVKGIRKLYPSRAARFGKARWTKAVDGVSFHLHYGEALGIVGESGSGKSTLIRSILRLIEPTEGSIEYEGIDVRALSNRGLRNWRRHAQLVFQDPYASLNPHYTIRQTVLEPMVIHGMYSQRERIQRMGELLCRVGLDISMADRYPHEFSGGQRQRIGIARALAINPKLLFLDEPVASLDVSVQAQILNLLCDLRDDLNLSYVFVAHDLSVVRYLCDTVIVMSQGKMVEMAKTEELFRNPLHPYTKTLLSAVPIPDPDVNMMQFDWREADITHDLSSFGDVRDSGSKPTIWEHVSQDHFVSLPAG